MRIMLDTNILVSMIFFPSSQTRELASALHALVSYMSLDLTIIIKRKIATHA